MRLIYLEWADSISNTGWKTREETLDWARNADEWIMRNVGWVVHEDIKQLVLASRWSPESNDHEEQLGLLQKIPKTWIKKRINLKEIK